ncbi:hypothetical protein CI109_105202 [Kwoniella shandongensis]|uniref:Uncharacterized protein n=1 Tax=Kwoniella shandongensis TaxID=1734106 RepID=A0A5M6C8V4_9TREE|nr:uncharacterized protein CI109_002044 [Kwoniella shandongensis]KAA5529619.1 hypothetical protein CI109_002044 [Kwoniella shandongensis]
MSFSQSLFASLRSSLPTAGPSTSRVAAFSTTAPSLVSKRKLLAKRRKAANLALQSSRIIPPESIDPVLGRVHYRAPSSRSTAPTPPEATNPWQGCRLQRILLDYDQIAYSAPPNYTSGERPPLFLPGISEQDQALLFGAIPHASSELKFAAKRGEGTGVELEQAKQAEMMMRILDLRNSGKEAVKVLNRQRVVDEFGNGTDTGSSAVQAALLTAKIHNLLAHATQNPKDTLNKRSLRLLVQQRARHLKYHKRTRGEESYDALLADLGLERGAVEGELLIPY